MAKYDPLERHLRNSNQRPLTMTFANIQQIIGANLPQSAYDWRPWWANDRSHVQARAWMNAGYAVNVVHPVSNNPNNSYVTFG
jgi:hypothetical protein